MTEAIDVPAGYGEVEILQAKAAALEKQLLDMRLESTAKLIQSELKTEALRAGMIDLDGLKLLDTSILVPDEDGEFRGAPSIIEQLRRDKPWLFGVVHSSSTAAVPATAAARRKLATEMSLDEWRGARAELLRKR